MKAEKKDYYKVLEVEKLANQEEIKKAYVKLVKKYHPDINYSYDAQAKMIEINEAYEVLKDREKRAAYDKFYFTQNYNSQHNEKTAYQSQREQTTSSNNANNKYRVFNELLNNSRFFFGNNYAKFIKNIIALQEMVYEKKYDEIEYCGSRLRIVLEIILISFANKVNPSLFDDYSVDAKKRSENLYRIKKINDSYNIDPNIITSLHNIRKFSNTSSHLNDESKDLFALSNVLNDIKKILSWISNLDFNTINKQSDQNWTSANNFPKDKFFVQNELTEKTKLKIKLSFIWSTLIFVFAFLIIIFPFPAISNFFANKPFWILFIISTQIWNIIANVHHKKGKNNNSSLFWSSVFSLSIVFIKVFFFFLSLNEKFKSKNNNDFTKK